MSYVALTIFFTLLLAITIPFVFIPGLPVIFLMFMLSVFFAFIDNFQHVTQSELIILGSIAAFAFIVDLISGILGAKIGGANFKSLMFGLVGLVLGTFALPIPVVGSVLGLFLGIYLGETLQHKSNKRAMKSAAYGLVGAVTGSVLNLILAAIFLIIFVLFALA